MHPPLVLLVLLFVFVLLFVLVLLFVPVVLFGPVVLFVGVVTLFGFVVELFVRQRRTDLENLSGRPCVVRQQTVGQVHMRLEQSSTDWKWSSVGTMMGSTTSGNLGESETVRPTTEGVMNSRSEMSSNLPA